MKPSTPKKVPGIRGVYITEQGKVTVNSGSPLQEHVSKRGCFVKVRMKRKVKTHYIRDLLAASYGESVVLSDIVRFVQDISWVRVYSKVAEDHVKVKVFYQGLGMMQTDKLDLYTLRDAKAIFNENGTFSKKWRPNQRRKFL